MPEPKYCLVWLESMLLGAYCSLVYCLSDQPVLPVPMLFPHQDKIHHLIAYGIMGILALRVAGYHRTWLGCFSPLQAALLFCAVYGLSDEIHQFYVAGRSTDLLDWCADITGALLGSSSMLWLGARMAVRQPYLP